MRPPHPLLRIRKAQLSDKQSFETTQRFNGVDPPPTLEALWLFSPQTLNANHRFALKVDGIPTPLLELSRIVLTIIIYRPVGDLSTEHIEKRPSPPRRQNSRVKYS